jgi:hypothetical protein
MKNPNALTLEHTRCCPRCHNALMQPLNKPVRGTNKPRHGSSTSLGGAWPMSTKAVSSIFSASLVGKRPPLLDALSRHACKLGLEGIVSKRKDSPYRPGQAPDWLGSSGYEARGRGGLGGLTADRKSFKAPSHRRSGSRSPAFASSTIFRPIASRIGLACSGVARSDPSAISKAMPIKRTVSPSKLWPSKKVLIGIRCGSRPAPKRDWADAASH